MRDIINRRHVYTKQTGLKDAGVALTAPCWICCWPTFLARSVASKRSPPPQSCHKIIIFKERIMISD